MSNKILSLVSNLSNNFVELFSKLNMSLHYEQDESFDYIIIDNSHDIVDVAELNPDSKIISLVKPENIAKFIQNNGVLVLDEKQLMSKYGQNLYSRFFQKKPSIHFREDFKDVYNEEFNFKLSSLEVTGNYSDKIYSFFNKKQFDATQSRIFFNDLITLFSQIESRVSFPLDFEVISNDQAIGMNVSVSIDDLNVDVFRERYMDVFTSMTKQSSFLELSFISDHNKINICAFWEKNQQDQSVLSLLNIPTIVKSKENIEFDVEETSSVDSEMLSEDELENLDLDTIAEDIFDEGEISFSSESSGEDSSVVPSGAVEEGDASLVKGTASEELIQETISSKAEEEENTDIVKEGSVLEEDLNHVKGQKEEAEETTVVDGTPAEKEKVQVVSEGDKVEVDENSIVPPNYLEDELVQKVKGSKEEDEAQQKFSSLEVDEKEFVQRVSSTETEDEFITVISSKLDEEIKDEFIRIQGSNEEFNLDRVVNKIITKMESENKITKDAKAYLQQIGSKAVGQKAFNLFTVNGAKEKEQAQMKLQKREEFFKEKAFEMEKEAKKAQIDLQKADTLHKSELRKMEKDLNAKDKVVEQTKIAMENALRHKDKELDLMREKLAKAEKMAKASQETGSFKSHDEVESKLLGKLDAEKQQSKLLAKKLAESQKEQKASHSTAESLKNHVRKLEIQIKGMQEQANKSQGPSTNERRLEAGMKKLQDSLKKSKDETVEMKRNFMKVKSENMALKNEVDKLKSKKAA